MRKILNEEMFLKIVEEYSEKNDCGYKMTYWISWITIEYILNTYFPEFIDFYWIGILENGTGRFKPIMRKKIRKIMKEAGWVEKREYKKFKKNNNLKGG